MSLLSPTPVDAFFKEAARRRVQVRPYIRRSPTGSPTQVGSYAREQEGADPNQDPVPLSSTKEKELQLWREWVASGKDPEKLRPLIKSFAPLIHSKANVYINKVPIPPAAVLAEFQIQFVNALESYDPSKGSLGTYVYRYLDKAKRFIAQYQNEARIPENRIFKIRQYKDAEEHLSDEYGRTPSSEELATYLKWPLAEVERMDLELRGDYITSKFEEDPTAIVPSREQEVIRLIKYELSDEERAVYEHLMGMGRPQISSTGDIAVALNMEPYKVSRLKAAIAKKVSRYLDNRPVLED